MTDGDAYFAAAIGEGGRSTVSQRRIDKAAKSIEEFFGGRPERVFPNKKGDLVMMGNGKNLPPDRFFPVVPA